jgi:hypothetical protein
MACPQILRHGASSVTQTHAVKARRYRTVVDETAPIGIGVSPDST